MVHEAVLSIRVLVLGKQGTVHGDEDVPRLGGVAKSDEFGGNGLQTIRIIAG